MSIQIVYGKDVEHKGFHIGETVLYGEDNLKVKIIGFDVNDGNAGFAVTNMFCPMKYPLNKSVFVTHILSGFEYSGDWDWASIDKLKKIVKKPREEKKVGVQYLSYADAQKIVMGQYHLGEVVRVQNNDGQWQDATIIAMDTDDVGVPYGVAFEGAIITGIRSHHAVTHALKGLGKDIEWEFKSTHSIRKIVAKKLVSPKKAVIKLTPDLIQIKEMDGLVEFIVIEDRKVVCIGSEGSLGIAICHPDDKFNLEMGKALSFYRACK